MPTSTRLSRRFFFGLLGAGGAAVVASKTSGTFNASTAAASIPPKALRTDGYLLTEHVKKYYRSAII